MKSCIFFLSVSLIGTSAWAQSTAAPAATPDTKLKARGPAAVAQEEPNRVVATIDGKPVTAQKAFKALQAMPPDQMKRFQQGQGGLQTALQQIYLMQHFADLAVQQHLDQQDPWKTQLDFYRENILAQAYITGLSNSTNPSSTDLKTYYDAHQPDFQEAKLSAIFVGFNPPGTPAAAGATVRTEQDAKAKADDLVKKLRAGGNFAELAKSDSDNKQSAEKGGELGTFTADKLPKEISQAVFKLKPGEITDPIRETTGFYILKVDSLNKKSFEQASGEIISTLKNEQLRKVMENTNKQYEVQVQDPTFFNLSESNGAKTPSLERPAPGQPKASK
jgi:peptidyl-prolyl cis-trans isomerase C